MPVTFSQQVLGCLCYLLSVISPDSTITHREGSYQALVSVPCTTPRGISHNQEYIPNIKGMYFPSLTVPHGFTKKAFKIFCNSPPEGQTSVKWEQNTWLTSREMKSLQDEEEVKH